MVGGGWPSQKLGSVRVELHAASLHMNLNLLRGLVENKGI